MLRFRSLNTVLMLCAVAFPACSFAAQKTAVAQPRYQNPVLYADYSDPDVIRVGEDFYLIASSFHFSPGIPILHSRDLVHWEITGHVLPKLPFGPAYDMDGGTRYGGGVWAPAVRFHAGLFYVYFPTPDEGIFVSTAPSMTGPWSRPVAVIRGPGWEDPCPFWDDDGKAYLVHSRLHAGPLILHRMSADGMRVLDSGKVIVEDAKDLPVLEGPKMYKRHGWYYIFAPMGGVGNGSQAVLRSRTIYGPYEYRIVLAQGGTKINGPHQGAYVETPDGRGWFLHFQLRGAHGRVVLLEPVRWVDDWPVMGESVSADDAGEPVAGGPLPVVVRGADEMAPQTSDDFGGATLAPMWEWNHNPDDAHWSLTERRGFLRLDTMFAPDLFHARNTLTESMQGNAFDFTARMETGHMRDGDRAGVSMFDKGLDYVAVVRRGTARVLVFSDHGSSQEIASVGPGAIELRAHVVGDTAMYFYSVDGGAHFLSAGTPVTMVFSWWKGARPALFAFNTLRRAGGGYVDFDWVRYRALARAK
ncbi:glycoside hydrolase 43 family protein [Edaphobacter sp.]|uniref:glycoside hydrolase family 43 protein n=1 Tax=Edaphobacter sp. TaxID=1934404 RepID=UPI002DB9BBE4|nr:glycoside hydrolase 43 family protein [Edaphobacter sp.]HEU5340774.1 glycoside hydrolase 43 family protein [Edaphobacter sp.]